MLILYNCKSERDWILWPVFWMFSLSCETIIFGSFSRAGSSPPSIVKLSRNNDKDSTESYGLWVWWGGMGMSVGSKKSVTFNESVLIWSYFDSHICNSHCWLSSFPLPPLWLIGHKLYLFSEYWVSVGKFVPISNVGFECVWLAIREMEDAKERIPSSSSHSAKRKSDRSGKKKKQGGVNDRKEKVTRTLSRRHRDGSIPHDLALPLSSHSMVHSAASGLSDEEGNTASPSTQSIQQLN